MTASQVNLSYDYVTSKYASDSSLGMRRCLPLKGGHPL